MQGRVNIVCRADKMGIEMWNCHIIVMALAKY